MQVLFLGEVGDFIGFIWNIIKDTVDGIINAVNFIKDLIIKIPEFISGLPTEISVLLLSALSTIIIVFIFKFIK